MKPATCISCPNQLPLPPLTLMGLSQAPVNASSLGSAPRVIGSRADRTRSEPGGGKEILRGFWEGGFSSHLQRSGRPAAICVVMGGLRAPAAVQSGSVRPEG